MANGDLANLFPKNTSKPENRRQGVDHPDLWSATKKKKKKLFSLSVQSSSQQMMLIHKVVDDEKVTFNGVGNSINRETILLLLDSLPKQEF